MVSILVLLVVLLIPPARIWTICSCHATCILKRSAFFIITLWCYFVLGVDGWIADNQNLSGLEEMTTIPDGLFINCNNFWKWIVSNQCCTWFVTSTVLCSDELNRFGFSSNNSGCSLCSHQWAVWVDIEELFTLFHPCLFESPISLIQN